MAETRVLWFSRHKMTKQQESDLFSKIKTDDGVIITQVSETINNVSEIPDIGEYDIYAIVAPIALQQQFLRIAAADKPVIMAKSNRVITKNPEGGEDKISFVFDKWERIKKIEVVIEDF